MQTEVVKLALDLLVREPDIEGFFGALTKEMVEESESHTCGVWLIDESGQRCDLWMVYVKDRLFTPRKDDWERRGRARPSEFPARASPIICSSTARVERDGRVPERRRAAARGDSRVRAANGVGDHRRHAARARRPHLGWMTVSSPGDVRSPRAQWWRVALIEAVARQAALALHHSRLIDSNRREERRKAILEERNRLARDIHDNLAQGFAAILMQLQAAQRESGGTLPVAGRGEHRDRRRSGAHAPDGGAAIGRRASARTSARARTSRPRSSGSPTWVSGRRNTPIDLVVDELPRLGDAVEREIIGIAQEALTNAVRHSRARRITIRASAVAVRRPAAVGGRRWPRHRARSTRRPASA